MIHSPILTYMSALTVVERAIVDAKLNRTALTEAGKAAFAARVPGLTSPFLRRFLNALCGHSLSYVEVGTLLGATAVAAKYGNPHCAVTAVDNFSYCDTVADIDKLQGIDLCRVRAMTPRQAWRAHVDYCEVDVHLIEGDWQTADLASLKPQVFYYDADHSYEQTHAALTAALGWKEPPLLILLDDYHHAPVRQAVRDCAEGFVERWVFDDEWNGFFVGQVR